jgi:hypothetical protein
MVHGRRVTDFGLFLTSVFFIWRSLTHGPGSLVGVMMQVHKVKTSEVMQSYTGLNIK